MSLVCDDNGNAAWKLWDKNVKYRATEGASVQMNSAKTFKHTHLKTLSP